MNQAFDELAKALAEDVSRREALRRVGSVLATALLASFGLKTAWGACPSGKTLCSAKCVNLRTDDKNCGSCGTVCARGQSCVNGTCTRGGGGGGGGGCPSGQTRCNGKCVSLQTDPNNCGSCGHVCPYGTNQLCCSGTCVQQWSDTRNCGSCGNTCTSDKFCISGVCTCDYWQTDCGGTCVGLLNDPANCGSCGHACGSGETCCNGTCVDLQTNSQYCGGCYNNACTGGKICCGGTCVADAQNCGACGHACGSGETCCSGTCKDLRSDPNNCGFCGYHCGSNQVCNNSTCGPPPTLCNGVYVDTDTDPNNCGACGRSCSSGACFRGSCNCLPGWNACGGTGCCPPTLNGLPYYACNASTCFGGYECWYSDGTNDAHICPS